MDIRNTVVLVTGANRGIGLAFARAALARGARKVYAGARDPARVTLAGVEPVRLDVTRADEVAAVAARLGDVTLLVNNAGIARTGSLLQADADDSLRAHLDTNLFGMLRMARAFAPVLAAHGGGAMLNVLSVVSWISSPVLGAYAVSKSAAWSLTNGLRLEMKAQGTQVLGLHMGFVDTELTQGFDLPKVTPAVVVTAAFDALEAGLDEVMADEIAHRVKQSLSADAAAYLRNVRE